MEIQINNMNLNDLESICSNLEKDFDDFWNYNILKNELQNPNSIYFVAKDKNNNILGFIIFEIKDKRSKTLWIDQLVVDEKERGKGISSLLIKKAEEIAKKEKCVRVEFCCWSFNKHANEIYNHLGFKEQRVIFEKEI